MQSFSATTPTVCSNCPKTGGFLVVVCPLRWVLNSRRKPPNKQKTGNNYQVTCKYFHPRKNHTSENLANLYMAPLGSRIAVGCCFLSSDFDGVLHLHRCCPLRRCALGRLGATLHFLSDEFSLASRIFRLIVSSFLRLAPPISLATQQPNGVAATANTMATAESSRLG